MSILSELVKLAYQVGGSHKTKSDRQNHVKKFAQYLSDNNIQIKSVDHIKSIHVETYVQNRKQSKAIIARTLQNEMAAVRVTLRLAGRTTLADSERLSNKSLGIGNACRDGTHKAMPQDVFELLCESLRLYNQDVLACIQLQRWIGLRNEEALRSYKSIKSWLKELERGNSIRVIYGTKGGHPRDVKIFCRDRTISAIKFAIEIMNVNGGKIISKPNLKSAMEHHRYILRAANCVGEYSPHSLRYAFACDQVEFYQKEGFSLVDALAMTSMDLGHGDGRGRYIKQVYMKK